MAGPAGCRLAFLQEIRFTVRCGFVDCSRWSCPLRCGLVADATNPQDAPSIVWAVRLASQWACHISATSGSLTAHPHDAHGSPSPTSLRRRGCERPLRAAQQRLRAALLGRAAVEPTRARRAIHHGLPADGRERHRGAAGRGSCPRRGVHMRVILGDPRHVRAGGSGSEGCLDVVVEWFAAGAVSGRGWWSGRAVRGGAAGCVSGVPGGAVTAEHGGRGRV